MNAVESSFAAPAPTVAATAAASGRAPRTLAAAVVLGIAGDQLLRGDPPRFGATIWLAMLVTLALLIGDRDRERRWLLLGIVVASLGLSMRDSMFLGPVDVMSVLCMGALVIWHVSGRTLSGFTVIQAPRAVALAILTALVGATATIRDAVAQGGGSEETGKRARLIVISALLALPPLVLVASLLGESDIVFGGFLDDVFAFLGERAIEHAFVILVLTWAGAGWLRGATGDGTIVKVVDPASPRAPFLLLSVGVYGMIALLALFLGTQARVLFGGEGYLQAAVGLTRAEYARNGFFEMVAAAGVVLVSLVIADWLLADDDYSARKRFRASGLVLVVQVALLLLSAASRMGMYVGEFGWSTERAYASAVMLFVSLTLVAFSRTTLRARATRFGPALLGVTIAWVALINLVNVEAMVVRTNVARAERGESFDAAYHAGLSADALPALLANASRLAAPDCERLRAGLAAHWSDADRRRRAADWRGQSVPLRRALRWSDAGAPLPCAR